jgi:hypothetical protein
VKAPYSGGDVLAHLKIESGKDFEVRRERGNID